MKNAIIIVLEGSDGFGKETQANKLNDYLNSLGLKSNKISFPMYDKKSSECVKRYLAGEFGDVSNPDLNEYGCSLFYSIDRYISYITYWKKLYKESDVLIMDRYVTSNLIYNGAKIKSLFELTRFIDWMEDFEYAKLGLPRPDMTLFLNMTPEASYILREKRKNKITGGNEKDIHEKNNDFLNTVYRTAFMLSDFCKWTKIDCIKNAYVKYVNDILTPDEIFENIKSAVLSNQKIKRRLKAYDN